MDPDEKARRVKEALETEIGTLTKKGDFQAVAAIATFLNSAPVGSFVRLHDILMGSDAK